MTHDICIITGAWQRHELFEFFCKYYADLQKKVPFELIVACSESQTLEITKKYGHTAVTVNNHPLTRKMNAAAQMACGADYTICIGSDDFITEKTLRHYITLFDRGIDYIGVLDWWFYDSRTGKANYWGGYNKDANRGHSCGAGRALSQSLMDKLAWQPWAAGYDLILDTGMDKSLAEVSYTKHIFSLNQLQLFALDIKSEVNMTRFDNWPNTIPINGKDMLKKHMPEWADEILKL